MNKKIGLLLFLVLILTGCKANYVIKYENGEFSEHLEIVNTTETYKEDEAHPTYDDLVQGIIYASIDGTEKWTADNDSNKYDIKATHKLEKTTLKDTTVFNECFPLSTYKEGSNSIYFSVYGEYRCNKLEKGSSFILETTAPVIDSNHTSKEGNKYIWDLSNKNVQKDGIYFQVEKESSKEIKKKNKSAELIPWYVKFIISVIVIAGVLWAIIYIKNRG